MCLLLSTFQGTECWSLSFWLHCPQSHNCIHARARKDSPWTRGLLQPPSQRGDDVSVIRRVQSCAQTSDSRDFSTAMIPLFISSRAMLGMVTRMRKIFCQKQRQLPSVCQLALLPRQGGSWKTRSPHRHLAGWWEPLGFLQAWLQPSHLQVQVLALAGPEDPSPVAVLWLSL